MFKVLKEQIINLFLFYPIAIIIFLLGSDNDFSLRLVIISLLIIPISYIFFVTKAKNNKLKEKYVNILINSIIFSLQYWIFIVALFIFYGSAGMGAGFGLMFIAWIAMVMMIIFFSVLLIGFLFELFINKKQ